YSRIVPTPTGSPLRYPLVGSAETSNAASTVAENTQLTETDLSGIGFVNFGQCPLWSATNLARLSLALIQDIGPSGVYPQADSFDRQPWPFAGGLNVEQILTDAFSGRLARGTDTAWAASAIAGPGASVTTASASAIAYADLIALYYKLDASFRGSKSAAFVMAPSTVQAIRNITDTASRPILKDFRPVDLPDGPGWDLTSGLVTSTLFGLPVVESSNVPAIAATKTVAILADWSRYFIVRVAETPAIQRLDERFADYGEVGFTGFARLDAAVGLADAAVSLVMHS
ncbi:MAG TPA: phage major capsid protein, partial [Candidatus Binatia bacterium]|nr:phage major capsid protein [Candidatus Binatia bacterium]